MIFKRQKNLLKMTKRSIPLIPFIKEFWQGPPYFYFIFREVWVESDEKLSKSGFSLQVNVPAYKEPM